MEKKPNLLTKISGNTWDKDDEPVMIDTEDQCRGVIQFTIDDDRVQSRMYGDVTLGDLATVLHMLQQTFGEEDIATARKVADELGRMTDASEADSEREGVQALPGQDGGLQDDM